MVQRWIEDMDGGLFPSPYTESGEWVAYEDYLALEQKYNKLYGQLLRWRAWADSATDEGIEEQGSEVV